MAIPHVCPKCYGEAEIIKDCLFIPCPVCKDANNLSTGLIWETTLLDATDSGQALLNQLHGK